MFHLYMHSIYMFSCYNWIFTSWQPWFHFMCLVIRTLVWIGNTEESKVNCMNPQMNCWLRWLVQFTIDSFRATSDQVWVGSFRPWTQCFDFFPISRPNKGWILFREVYETFVENGDIRWVWSLWSKCDLIEISCQTFSKSWFRRRNQLSHESCRALNGQEATQTEKKQAWITIFVSMFKNIGVVLFWLFFWGSIYAL